MNNCLLVTPSKDKLMAQAGDYPDDFDIESIITNEDFVLWEGSAARHFVPVDFYRQFLTSKDNRFDKTYGSFDYFVFLENNNVEHFETILIDDNNYMIGEWFCALWKHGKLIGFNELIDAEAFYYWLTSRQIQKQIYEKTKGKTYFSPSTYLN